MIQWNLTYPDPSYPTVLNSQTTICLPFICSLLCFKWNYRILHWNCITLLSTKFGLTIVNKVWISYLKTIYALGVTEKVNVKIKFFKKMSCRDAYRKICLVGEVINLLLIIKSHREDFVQGVGTLFRGERLCSGVEGSQVPECPASLFCMHLHSRLAQPAGRW